MRTVLTHFYYRPYILILGSTWDWILNYFLNQNCAHSFDSFLLSTVYFDLGFDLRLDLEFICLNQNCAHSIASFSGATVSFDLRFGWGLDLELIS